MAARLFSVFMLVVIAVGGGGGPLRAAEPAAQDALAPIDTLIHNLHSTSYPVREAATLGLMRLGAERRSDVEQALARETDPESVVRLERAAVHLFMKARTSMEGEIGVLGISLLLEAVQLDPKSPRVQMAVVVIKTQPGFPAAESLEPADRILGIDGEWFTLQSDSDRFRKQINETRPGTVVMLTVLRDGKRMDIPVRVAGLRMQDAPLFQAIVRQRDAAAAEYAAGLKSGIAGHPLVIAGQNGELTR